MSLQKFKNVCFSSKFWRKLIYVRTLDELYHLVPVERAAVPEKVKKYDLKYT